MPPEEEIKIEEPEIASTEKVDDAISLSDEQGFGEAKENNNSNTESSTEVVVSESMKPEESPLPTSLPEEIPLVSSKSELQSVEASVMEQNTESVTKSDELKEYLSENKSYVSRLLDRANNALSIKRQKKLDKIVEFAKNNRTIKNDDIEKLLRISDATATRYLAKLVKSGRLRRAGGKTAGITYEINK